MATKTVRRDQMPDPSPAVRAKFTRLLRQWNKHRKSRQVMLSARPHEDLNCEAYREIVKLGTPALPLIIEEMRRGDNLIFLAVNDITGLTIDAVKKELAAKGVIIVLDNLDSRIRNTTTLYLLWWDVKVGESIIGESIIR